MAETCTVVNIREADGGGHRGSWLAGASIRGVDLEWAGCDRHVVDDKLAGRWAAFGDGRPLVVPIKWQDTCSDCHTPCRSKHTHTHAHTYARVE